MVGRPRGGGWVSWVLRVFAAGGLAVDAYIHLQLAPTYDAVGTTITQGTLFRIEAAVAAVVVVLLLLIGRTTVYVTAALVAGSALGAVILYRWVDVGALGPLPNMYESVWYPDKTISALGEAVATAAAVALVAIALHARRGERGLRAYLANEPSPGCVAAAGSRAAPSC